MSERKAEGDVTDGASAHTDNKTRTESKVAGAVSAARLPSCSSVALCHRSPHSSSNQCAEFCAAVEKLAQDHPPRDILNWLGSVDSSVEGIALEALLSLSTAVNSDHLNCVALVLNMSGPLVAVEPSRMAEALVRLAERAECFGLLKTFWYKNMKVAPGPITWAETKGAPVNSKQAVEVLTSLWNWALVRRRWKIVELVLAFLTLDNMLGATYTAQGVIWATESSRYDLVKTLLFCGIPRSISGKTASGAVKTLGALMEEHAVLEQRYKGAGVLLA
jgi:hypothetical protein